MNTKRRNLPAPAKPSLDEVLAAGRDKRGDRETRHDGWTAERIRLFLETLAETGTVETAAGETPTCSAMVWTVTGRFSPRAIRATFRTSRRPPQATIRCLPSRNNQLRPLSARRWSLITGTMDPFSLSRRVHQKVVARLPHLPHSSATLNFILSDYPFISGLL